MNTIYFDIETIALPAERRQWMKPDRDSVSLGNLKDPIKIEAKIAEEMAAWERGDDAALDALQGQVALIGYAVNDGPVQHLQLDGDEGDLLLQWWALVENLGIPQQDSNRRKDVRLVAHNVRFDAPFLIRRSWMLDAMPKSLAWLVDDLMQYRPQHWLDTGLRWALGDRQPFVRKLAHIAPPFGATVKESEVTGATFGHWWRLDRAACLAYNAQDVEATRRVWLAIGE
jgi:hypothetical protein